MRMDRDLKTLHKRHLKSPSSQIKGPNGRRTQLEARRFSSMVIKDHDGFMKVLEERVIVLISRWIRQVLARFLERWNCHLSSKYYTKITYPGGPSRKRCYEVCWIRIV